MTYTSTGQTGPSLRSVLETLDAASEGRPARTQPAASPLGPGRCLAFLGATTALLVLGFATAIVVSVRAFVPRCEPITYAFEGSPPAEAVAEFRFAIQEIHRHTGLEFEPGDAERAMLSIDWSDQFIDAAKPTPALSGAGTARVLGLGAGSWREGYGRRYLIRGVVEVDGTLPWQFGLDRGNALAAVFVHELGHVIGLAHSPEPTSFMHHVRTSARPVWTAHEVDQLAEAGRRSGCRPPPAGAQSGVGQG